MGAGHAELGQVLDGGVLRQYGIEHLASDAGAGVAVETGGQDVALVAHLAQQVQHGLRARGVFVDFDVEQHVRAGAGHDADDGDAFFLGGLQLGVGLYRLAHGDDDGVDLFVDQGVQLFGQLGQ
ncbi:hypothetical protein D3C72_2147560 [compost metagenome]